MKPWLYVGAKVVCVDASGFGGPVPLTEGVVYTVIQVWPPRPATHKGQPVVIVSVNLAEQRNPRAAHGDYAADRFRPVSTIDTSKQIEAMRNLMLDATVRGKVDA